MTSWQGPIVDAHQHFWNPASGYGWLAREIDALQRTFTFEDLAPHLDRHQVTGTVLVQADDTDADTDAMFAAAANHPQILGIVGYVPLDRPDEAADRLSELQTRARFVGVRNLIHDQPDPDWLLRADVAEGLALLETHDIPFDLVAVLPRHLEHVHYLISRFPGLRIVIDHLAKPPVTSNQAEPWTTLMRQAASHPQVYAKISGLYPTGAEPTSWTVDDLRPWVDTALELFSPDRLMVGSDWPVAITAGGYDRVFGALVQLLTEYGPAVAAPTLAGTAVNFYRLDASAGANR